MEFNIKSLRANTDQENFYNGLKIYLNNEINYDKLVITNLGTETKYTYTVISSDQNSSYSVVVKLSKKEDKYFLNGCLCKCFYFHNNKVICEHTVALCLIVMDHLNYGNEELDELSKQFYKKEKENKLINLFAYNNYTNIRLRPNFIFDKNKILMRLIIIGEKEYTISSISNFLEAVETKSLLKYGKKLEFVHEIDCFDKRAKELIELLSIIKLEFEAKNLILNPTLFEKIIEIYKDDVLDISVSGTTFKINNSLKENKINILIDTNNIELLIPKHVYYVLGYNKMILITKDETNVVILSNYELIFIKNLIDKNIDILESEEFFFSNVYPKVKNIITISKEVEEKFPIYDLVIDSYFDLNNSKIELKTIITENDKEVLKEDLSILSKVSYFEYEQILKQFNFSLKDYCISDSTYIVDFLHSDITDLKSFGKVFLSEKIKKANVKKTGVFSLGINYNMNLLELNIKSLLSNEELEAILSSYRNKEKYVVLKSNVIFEIDEDVAELSRIVEQYHLDEEDLTTPKLKPSYAILNLLTEKNISNKESFSVLEDFSNYSKKDIYPIDKINTILRPYQLDAYRWLHTIANYGFGGLLADDMGLGKSLEILSLVLSDEIEKPTIIISPMSLVYNWRNEIIKWGNDIKVNIVLGSISDRKKILNSINYNKKEIYLISYDILKKDIEYLIGEFRYVIIDEAQYIKNKNTKTAISVKKLNSQVRFALTGTPIENSLSDLWSIFDFILPNYLNSYNKFKEEYESSDLSFDTLDDLQSKVAPFILRRTKKDVLTELPDKIEEVYYTELSNSQQKLYNAFLSKARNSLATSNEIEILSILTRLRQICVSPKMFLSDYNEEEVKIDLTMDLISKAIFGDHKILLFSQFTSSFEILKKRLIEQNISYYELTGKTSAKDRVNLSNEFNTKDDVKLFLISLKAGGTGLNLYGADTVIHLDPWWNLSAESQATDRAHRIGQKKVLNVIKIICANTIEEKVLKLQNAKAELSSKVIDSSQTKNKRLNLKDLEFLLS